MPGLISLRDEFGQSGVGLAYDTVAESYAEHFPGTRAEAPLDLAMVDAFVRAVAEGRGGRVLDAGCGTGRMSRYLADRGCDAHPTRRATRLPRSPVKLDFLRWPAWSGARWVPNARTKR